MKMYCINLDRHAQRMERMQKLLQGLSFERIAAVDGRTLTGPDRRDKSIPATAETLTRFERACLASHRLAWTRFLESDRPFACFLEDDLVLSPDFTGFIDDESWIPATTTVIKLETFFEQIVLSQKTIPARGRELAEIRSLHNGSGAYLLSRCGAERLLAATASLAQPVDVAMFAPEFSRSFAPVWQLVPALCIQAQHDRHAMTLDELKSSIQPGWVRPRKTLRQRVKKETLRPFQQFAATAIDPLKRRLNGSRLAVVPHA